MLDTHSPPDTLISSGPDGPTSLSSASFSFSSTKPDSTFECRLDGPGASIASYASCTSPTTYSGLADGSYTFSVRANDRALNTDPSPASRSFTVTTVTSGYVPPSPVFGPAPAQTVPPALPVPAGGRLGTTVFPAPRTAVRVSRGRALLRFSCPDSDGCAARAFTLTGPPVRSRRGGRRVTRPAFAITVAVGPVPAGPKSVAVTLTRPARRALKRGPRRGVAVKLTPRDGRPGVPFRLVARPAPDTRPADLLGHRRGRSASRP